MRCLGAAFWCQKCQKMVWQPFHSNLMGEGIIRGGHIGIQRVDIQEDQTWNRLEGRARDARGQAEEEEDQENWGNALDYFAAFLPQYGGQGDHQWGRCCHPGCAYPGGSDLELIGRSRV